MGGDSDQPYIYEPSLQNRRTVYPYSDFNPKSVSQASYQALKRKEEQKKKAKQDGPLINFNQHPDSYMIVAGQNVQYKPMSAKTPKIVAGVRWTQFSLRILEEVGAIGLLVAVICLKNIETALSWIVRIAPAWDIVITLYALYHLARGAKLRTPASSASYHTFALIMDVGLVPFYIFISLYSNNNYSMDEDKKSRWTSFFTEEGATTTLLYATFLASATMAGFHAVSAILDLWLIIIFRKIAKLPPDLNPLEDNLTSRSSRQSKHKHKNSEATLTDSMAEKKPGYLSGSTLSVDQNSRLSTATKDGERAIPFSHSRTGSAATFSPHNPQTARMSRQYAEDMSIYQQSQSMRGSRNDVYGDSRAASMTPSKRASFVPTATAPGSERMNSMRPTSYPTERTGTAISNPARLSSPALPNAAESKALVRSQQKDSLLNDNWYVLDDSEGASTSPSRQRTPNPVIQLDRHDSFDQQPLKMHPPTPPPPHAPKQREWPDPETSPGNDWPIREERKVLTARNDNGNGALNRHLTVQSTATNTSSVYSESAPSLKSSALGAKQVSKGPKGKYYGDLAAATRGVRCFSNDTLKSNSTVAAATMDSTGMAALGSYGYGPPSPIFEKRTPRRDGKGRVVSRTGADIADAQLASYGIRGRRDVSGKVAEEGRGGGGNWWRGSGY